MSRNGRWAKVLGALGCAGVATVLTAGVGPYATSPAASVEIRGEGEIAGAAPAPSGQLFQAVNPVRLADTRLADCGCTRIDQSTIRVQVAGRPGLPAGVSAATLVVTVTNTTSPGYLTVWPAGTSRRETSTLNWAAGETRANSTIIRVGAGGAVDLFVSGQADLIVDINGAFSPAQPSGTSAGRFVPFGPARVVDTRSGARLGSGQTIRVALPAGVPADATALAVNLTATDSAGAGFLSVFAAGLARPNTSAVNTDRAGQTRAATVFVAVNASGFDVYSFGGHHVLVDVVGWFTGASAEVTTAGTFVAVEPLRLLDTRFGAPIGPGGTIELNGSTPEAINAMTDVMTNGGVIVGNVTMTETAASGYMTAYSARTSRPQTSSINWTAGETVANLAVTQLSSASVAYYASAETDLMLDLTGYFIGQPIEVSAPVPTDSPQAAQEANAEELIRSSVPTDVFALLDDVAMVLAEIDPYDGYAEAPIALGPANGPDFPLTGKITFDPELFERSPTVAEAVAAHEVGHILAFHWVSMGNISASNPDATVQSLGGHECVADGVGRVLFARMGRHDFDDNHYDGTLIDCSTTQAMTQLAIQIVDLALASESA